MNCSQRYFPDCSAAAARSFFILLFLFHLQIGSGQEQLGLRAEKYSGISGMLLNPANMANSPFRWDLNLVEAATFFENNYAHFRDASLGRVIREAEDMEVATDFDDEAKIPPNALVLDFNDSTNKKFVLSNSAIMGPSFAVRLENGSSFGFMARFRAVVGSRGIPHQLSYEYFDKTPFFDNITIPPFQVAGMVWSEYGLNYTHSLEMADGNLNIGGTVKLLLGYEGFYFKLNQGIDVVQIPGDTLAVSKVDFSYGFTDGNTGDEDVETSINGNGLGLDLGVNYVFDTETGLTRLGAGLIDIGRIKFDNFVQNHRIEADLTANFIADELGDSDINEFSEILSYQLMGDSLASAQESNFPVWLPMALTLQGDYYFSEYFGANATLVKGIPLGQIGVRRGDMFSLTPHFSHRWFSASLPVVLYNWQQLNFGLSVRLAFLSLGTDNLGSFFGKKEFTGTDFYIGLKLNPFQLNGNFGGGGGRRGKSVRCYEF